MSKTAKKVGYGQPPADKQFKAGKSGNPKGRPKKAKKKKPIMDRPILKYLHQINMEMHPVLQDGKVVEHLPLIALLYKKLAINALKGDSKALTACIATYKFAQVQPVYVPEEPFEWPDELDKDIPGLEEFNAEMQEFYAWREQHKPAKPPKPANDTAPPAKQKPDDDDDGLVLV